ncbi:MAG: hypothetical protein JO013_03210 [Alphaproteobacteria bacterium]|nr:hypothetical protein [Alphaproteobacteria bacterium]
MRQSVKLFLAATIFAPFAAGCSTDQGGHPAGAQSVATTGSGGGGGTSTGGGGGGGTGGIPALVNVNLQNVLNDLSVRLNIDRANIPVNAQVPIDVAANVCGVSVNVLSLSNGGKGTCTAKTATPQLAQVVQQQVAAGGSVGGGAQGGSTATTGGSTGTGGSGTSGSQGTGGSSTGTSETTNPPPPTTPPHG